MSIKFDSCVPGFIWRLTLSLSGGMPPSKGATKEERATKACLRGSQLETGAEYLAICQVIKDDPKLLQAVSRELIAQGALTSMNGCLKIVDQSKVATEKPKAMVEDEKQLHRNFITWEDVPPMHYEFWFDRMEGSLSKAALVKVWMLAKPVKIQFCKQLLEFTTGWKPQQKVGDVKRIRAIGDAFVKDNLFRGRPACNLRFPVDWERDGHYAVLCALARWVMAVRPWGFQVVIDMDELRVGDQLTVDMKLSLEDAALMIKLAVRKTVRCHLFFVQQGKGAGAGNLELQNDKQGLDATGVQKLLALPCVPFRKMPVACRSPTSSSSKSRLRQGSSPQDQRTCRRCWARRPWLQAWQPWSKKPASLGFIPQAAFDKPES